MISPHLKIINQLRASEEPSIKYSVAIFLDKADPNTLKMQELREEIRNSTRVQSLLSHVSGHVYSKWQGAHWVLSLLAELHYPPSDDSLLPLLNQAYDWLFSERFLKRIKIIHGKVRRCASQEGNAIYYSYALGLTNERTEQLVDRLLKFQWPDGGWNCDKNPEAQHSSYHESLIPLRALIRYLKDVGNKLPTSRKNIVQNALNNAKEVFLKRKLYLSLSNGKLIHPDFTFLYFPYYWRYNVLFALKVLNEGGFIMDPRCHRALELIESKELPTGGFPAEKKHYTFSNKARTGRSAVNWGGTGKQKLNEWVTLEVFNILNAVGRLKKQ